MPCSVTMSMDTDDSWLVPDKPSNQSDYMMAFAAVIVVAAILIFSGAPTENPFVFLVILAVVCGFGFICALFNREIAIGLGFKRKKRP